MSKPHDEFSLYKRRKTQKRRLSPTTTSRNDSSRTHKKRIR
jgi:hypothetical protein